VTERTQQPKTKQDYAVSRRLPVLGSGSTPSSITIRCMSVISSSWRGSSHSRWATQPKNCGAARL